VNEMILFNVMMYVKCNETLLFYFWLILRFIFGTERYGMQFCLKTTKCRFNLSGLYLNNFGIY